MINTKIKAQKLRKLRNQILHNGKPPLEFGCELKLLNIEHFPYMGATIGRLNDNDFRVYFPKGSIEYIPEWFEILGKPTSWGDVLRMLPYDEVAIELFDEELHIHIDGGNRIAFDLTRSPEEQDEDVIERLVGLLTNNK